MIIYPAQALHHACAYQFLKHAQPRPMGAYLGMLRHGIFPRESKAPSKAAFLVSYELASALCSTHVRELTTTGRNGTDAEVNPSGPQL